MFQAKASISNKVSIYGKMNWWRRDNENSIMHCAQITDIKSIYTRIFIVATFCIFVFPVDLAYYPMKWRKPFQ